MPSSHARLTIATLIFLLCAGMVAYVTIPKEAEPDVRVPIIYVQLSQRGISPEDSERLLLRPVETQLKSVGNVKEMRSTAFEGGGFVLLEFEAGFDSKSALADVRAKVDQAKHDLPKDVDEPQVLEVNLSLYPVLVVALSGDVPERTLLHIARTAKNAIEQAPGVLSAELRGARDEAVEIIAEPMLMKSYGVSLDQFITGFSSYNSLIAAGALEGETGRFAVKVPSLIEHPQDALKVPVVATAGAAVTLGDLAEIKPTFKDATSVTRVNGKPAMTIEVSKRTGANLIETVDAVKATVAALQKTWPEAVHVTFTQDKSKMIRQMLADLQNSVLTGVILVVVVILFALGFRASLFIGIAIPASFLAGVLGLQLAGLTVNIVVLFSLILAVGMLVDDAIIVSEFAERRMSEGMDPKAAYALAAKRMSGPVIAATATRIAAFSPLLFWPGIVGEFMKYLPITLIATLSASLAVALFFTPTLGALLGRAAAVPHDEGAKRDGLYMRTVRLAVGRPGATLGLALALLVAVMWTYGKVGQRGRVLSQCRARLWPRHRAWPRQSFARREGPRGRRGRAARADLRGPQDRLFARGRAAARLERHHRGHHRGHPVRVRGLARPAAGARDHGRDPGQDRGHSGRPGRGDGTARRTADRQADPDRDRRHRSRRAAERGQEGRRHPGAAPRHPRPRRWPAAARHRLEDRGRHRGGGQVRGRPQHGRHRRPARHQRGQGHRIPPLRQRQGGRHSGAVPARPAQPRRDRRVAGADALGLRADRKFRRRVAAPRVGFINRVAGYRVMTVSANVPEGAQTAKIQEDITRELNKADLGPGVVWRLKGEDEERAKASAFLLKAFATALFLIFAILLAQFNKFVSVALVLTAIVLSTIGVLLGLLIMGQPFGVVMTGIGVIANAGVIVNNNIVLIDTYDRLRREGREAYDAIIETCRERARPVVLTATTAVLGVLPIAFGVNVEFMSRSVTVGAPSTQWWISLSTAIVFGLAFATVLTLVVTPAALMAIEQMADRRRRWGAAWRARFARA